MTTDANGMAWGPGFLATVDTGLRVTAEVEPGLSAAPVPHCRVFWGSHGCMHPRGHSPEIPHECDCCECPGETCKRSCVAKPPYYGSDTRFYGEEAEALGLPIVS
jgi:hypothetical protein